MIAERYIMAFEFTAHHAFERQAAVLPSINYIVDLALRIQRYSQLDTRDLDVQHDFQADYTMLEDSTTSVIVELFGVDRAFPRVVVELETPTQYMLDKQPVLRATEYSFVGRPLRTYPYRLSTIATAYGVLSDEDEYAQVRVRDPGTWRGKLAGIFERTDLAVEDRPAKAAMSVDECDRIISALNYIGLNELHAESRFIKDKVE